MTDEEFNPEVDADAQLAVPDPTYRATVRKGRVMLTNWANWLASGGMWNGMLDARSRAGVTIADITIVGEDDSDVLVRFLSDGRSREDATAALCDWAERVGYRRIWFDDRLEVILDDEPAVIGKAKVRCQTCGSRWQDSTPEFWAMVREMGTFPRWCMLCGCELPQWDVVSEKAET